MGEEWVNKLLLAEKVDFPPAIPFPVTEEYVDELHKKVINILGCSHWDIE